jgi:acetone carboxylase gamma subunit
MAWIIRTNCSTLGNGTDSKADGKEQMMYEYICPDCGAHLDPEEKCNCMEEEIDDKDKRASA